MDSIDYYNKNTKDFQGRAIHTDVQDLYQKFLKYVPYRGKILDAGCGGGVIQNFSWIKGMRFSLLTAL